MPPSGYKQNQSKFIVSFLNSCFNALLKEAEELELSLENALKREIENIDFAIRKDVYSDSANMVMLLTQSFYKKVQDTLVKSNEEFGIESVLKIIEIDMLEIDIESLMENTNQHV